MMSIAKATAPPVIRNVRMMIPQSWQAVQLADPAGGGMGRLTQIGLAKLISKI
jgi:hypothetical protein